MLTDVLAALTFSWLLLPVGLYISAFVQNQGPSPSSTPLFLFLWVLDSPSPRARTALPSGNDTLLLVFLHHLRCFDHLSCYLTLITRLPISHRDAVAIVFLSAFVSMCIYGIDCACLWGVCIYQSWR